MKGENKVDSMTPQDIADIAASFQEAVIDVLVTKTLRAAHDHGLTHISLVGGVAANRALRLELTRRAEKKGYQIYLPEFHYAQDNGAMVAGLAYHLLREDRISDLSLNAFAS